MRRVTSVAVLALSLMIWGCGGEEKATSGKSSDEASEPSSPAEASEPSSSDLRKEYRGKDKVLALLHEEIVQKAKADRLEYILSPFEIKKVGGLELEIEELKRKAHKAHMEEQKHLDPNEREAIGQSITLPLETLLERVDNANKEKKKKKATHRVEAVKEVGIASPKPSSIEVPVHMLGTYRNTSSELRYMHHTFLLGPMGLQTKGMGSNCSKNVMFTSFEAQGAKKWSIQGPDGLKGMIAQVDDSYYVSLGGDGLSDCVTNALNGKFIKEELAQKKEPEAEAKPAAAKPVSPAIGAKPKVKKVMPRRQKRKARRGGIRIKLRKKF
jgi:hypothetical protein